MGNQRQSAPPGTLMTEAIRRNHGQSEAISATWHADHGDERESNKLPLPSFRYRTVLTACAVDRAPTHAMPPPNLVIYLLAVHARCSRTPHRFAPWSFNQLVAAVSRRRASARRAAHVAEDAMK